MSRKLQERPLGIQIHHLGRVGLGRTNAHLCIQLGIF